MREIYSKAAFCIAATSAQSGNTGLFFDRNVQQLTPVTVEITQPNIEDLYSHSRPTPGTYLFGFHSPSLALLVNSSPLNGRAWVAQERFLSPRILHFTREVLAWECHESYTHENYTKTSVDAASNDVFLDANSLKRLPSSIRWQGPDIDTISKSGLFNRIGRQPSDGPDLLAQNTIYQAWGEFLYDYSGNNLTNESDIFVALNGVAEEVEIVMNSRLVAGLWEERLIEDLCWQSTHTCKRPTVWRAPSWSWASTTGPIHSAARKRHLYWVREEDRFPHKMAAVVKLNITTKPSGEVEQASVLLECRLIPASVCFRTEDVLCTMDESNWRPSIAEPTIGVRPNARPDTILIGLDDPGAARDHDHKVIDVQLLVLLRRGFLVDSPRVMEGLCIVESTRHPGAFERIGSFTTDKETTVSVRTALEKAKDQTILLL